MVIAETQFLDIQTFSVQEVGAVLFLAKRAKNDTPSIQLQMFDCISSGTSFFCEKK